MILCVHVRRTAIVAQCDVVWSLMRSFSSGQEPMASLPPGLQRVLMLSLLSCEATGERQQQFTREVGTCGCTHVETQAWVVTKQLLRYYYRMGVVRGRVFTRMERMVYTGENASD